jgi:hypothetical protein
MEKAILMLFFIRLPLPADGNGNHLHDAENNMPLEFFTGKGWANLGCPPDAPKKEIPLNVQRRCITSIYL